MLGIFFGIGALLTPFLIGTLLDRLGLHLILICLLAMSIAPFLLFLSAGFPAPKHEGGFSRGELRSVLGNPLLFLFGFLLFFQSGNEFTIGGWVSTYLGERFGLSGSVSAYVLAGYWAAVMVGRLLVSRFGGRIASSTLVLGSSVLALTGCLGLILAGPQAAVCASVVLIGLGFAAIFPTTLAQAGTVFPEYSGTAFSVILVMALSGGMSAPWLVGRIAQTHGVGAGFWITASSCAAIAVLQVIIRLRSRQTQH
jgi:fucose permease